MTIADRKVKGRSASDIVNGMKDILNKIYALIVKSKVGLYGELEVLHIRNDKVIDRHYFPNVITNTGIAEVAGLINEVTSGGFTYIAIGTGVTGELVTDSTLESEISSGGGSRASATPSRITTAVTNDTAQLLHTFSFTSGFAVTESGIFDAASVGVMLARKTFTAMNVANGDAIQITWKVQVS
jgi:hypothetical protein